MSSAASATRGVMAAGGGQVCGRRSHATSCLPPMHGEGGGGAHFVEDALAPKDDVRLRDVCAEARIG